MSNVVKLDPIRMCEISSATPSASNPSTSKYTAPHLRTGDKAPEITSIVNDEKNFPTLGAVGKTSVSAWNKSSETSCIQKMNSKIKECIQQEILVELARQKPKEEDYMKMTEEELIDDGWTILSLKYDPQVIHRINTSRASEEVAGLD